MVRATPSEWSPSDENLAPYGESGNAKDGQEQNAAGIYTRHSSPFVTSVSSHLLLMLRGVRVPVNLMATLRVNGL